MKTISARQMLALNANWIGITFMWNALHPIVLPALLLNYVTDSRKNTYLGLMTFGGLILAMLIQPVAGALSDRWVSPWGKRRPMLVMGTILSCICLGAFTQHGGIAWLLLGYFGLQFSSNFAQGPLQGLFHDRTPARQLGMASSYKNSLDLISMVAAAVIAGRLMSSDTHKPAAIILVILGLLVFSASITVFFTPEESSKIRTIHEGENSSQSHPETRYWWLIAERAVFLLGIYGLQTFGQYYIKDVLQAPDPARQTGDLLAAIGAATAVFVVGGGWLSDRIGAFRVLIISSVFTGLGMVCLAITSNMFSLIVFGSLVGAGIGLFLTSNWTLANQLVPETNAGRFLGLTNVATAGAAALARLQGPVVDYLNAIRPEEWIGYKGIFIFGGICIAVSTAFLIRIR